MTSAVLGIALVAVALGILALVLGLLFNAMQFPLGRAMERRRFQRAQEHCRRGDAHLESGDVDRALREFASAFHLDLVVTERSLLSEVHNYHTSLLSRLIAITEDLQGGTVRLMSLAKTDRLLSERGEIQKRYLALRDKKAASKDLSELLLRLRTNRRELDACLKQLVAEIAAARPVARYH